MCIRDRVYDNNWWEFPHQIPFWWTVLLDDPYFYDIVKDRWAFWRNNLIDCNNFTNQIDTWESILDPAANRNFTKWPILELPIVDWYIGETYAEELDYLSNWICQRILWMDQELDYIDTAVPPILSADEYTVYPNPTTEHLIIQSPDTLPSYPHTIRLFDLNQVLRWEQTITPRLEQTKINLSVPDLESGLFILEMSNSKSSSRWKVVIK